ncbi:Retrovirus-related Pol polyprotein from transposon RE1 [Cardamine amara subsp. amara]|uniref:Retrovirus-related Pol polyprotein from transposon RE1 n=1 Tax=Cardamine amara subsp. amara TaxID=228776 RepID=A0ABD1AC52_CARAN
MIWYPPVSLVPLSSATHVVTPPAPPLSSDPSPPTNAAAEESSPTSPTRSSTSVSSSHTTDGPHSSPPSGPSTAQHASDLNLSPEAHCETSSSEAHSHSPSTVRVTATSNTNCATSYTTNVPPVADQPQPGNNNPPENRHPMATRSKSDITKPITRYGYAASLVSSTHVIPKTVAQALKDPRWRKAMCDEIDAQFQNHTWTLEPLTSARHVVGSKWVFTIKYSPDG